MTCEISILLLAAGASSRMQGRDKLMLTVRGVPLLRHVCQQALATGRPCYVTLPRPDHPRAAVIQDLAIRQIFVPNASEGMAASIRAGMDQITKTIARNVMICPTDLPDLTQQHFTKMARAIETSPDTIVRAKSATGEWGHPVAFPHHLFAKLKTATGDHGPKHLFQEHPVKVVQFSDMAPTTDLDTPQAWEDWRNKIKH